MIVYDEDGDCVVCGGPGCMDTSECDMPEAEAGDLYSDPAEWRRGDRCPGCLASDGPYAFTNGTLAGCFVCGLTAVPAV